MQRIKYNGVVIVKNGEELQEKSIRYLTEIISDYKFLIDATVVLDNNFPMFAKNIKNMVLTQGRKSILMMPGKENSLLMNFKNEEKFKKNINCLLELHKEGMAIPLNGNTGFEGAFEQLPQNIKLCILTQDKSIADKVSVDIKLKRFEGYVIRYVNRYGYLSAYRDEKYKYQYKKGKKIEISKKLVVMQNKRLLKGNPPISGEKITVNDKVFVLGEKLKSSSDGQIYNLDNRVFAKIYRREFCDKYHMDKCSYIIEKKISDEYICWPKQLIFNMQGEFIGYTFIRYEGVELQKSVLKKVGLKKYFPKWEKQQLVELAITILKNIQRMHDENVLLGCVDLKTIMVKDEKTVYFTECDKWQIDGYPCLSRNFIFLPPEIVPYRKKIFLFNEITENYEVAVLVFMLMMPGITPYTQRGRKSDRGNVKEFPYPLGENHSKNLPVGLWRFVWSHLDYSLKRALYATFSKGGEYNVPTSRRSTKYWIHILQDYEKKLESGEFCKYDEYSALIYPDTFRKVQGVEYVKCENCGKDYPKWYMDQRFSHICKNCIHKKSNTFFVCEDCGRIFYYKVSEALVHKQKQENDGWEKQKHCDECKRNVQCRGCGGFFPAYKLKGGYCWNCNKKKEREKR